MVLGVITASSAVACANRTDADVRRAWDQSVADPKGPGASSEEDPVDGDPRRPGRPGRAGRTELVRVLGQAMNLLSSTSDPAVVTKLAGRWCEVEPQPIPSDQGEVRVCAPAPPVVIDGVSFVLELGTVGVVGLVATDLSGAQSEGLARKAQAQVERMCEQPWSESLDHKFHTCPVLGGSTLAVGRVQGDKRAEGWQVSIAVLGAS